MNWQEWVNRCASYGVVRVHRPTPQILVQRFLLPRNQDEAIPPPFDVYVTDFPAIRCCSESRQLHFYRRLVNEPAHPEGWIVKPVPAHSSINDANGDYIGRTVKNRYMVNGVAVAHMIEYHCREFDQQPELETKICLYRLTVPRRLPAAG